MIEREAAGACPAFFMFARAGITEPISVGKGDKIPHRAHSRNLAAINALNGAKKDPDDEVRQAATEALKKIPVPTKKK